MSLRGESGNRTVQPAGDAVIELESLILEVASGDRDAFERLYDRTSRYVYGVLLRVLGDRERATDVAQEVYAQVWRTADDYDPTQGSALAWLAMIARSRAVDRSRSDGSYDEALESLEGAGKETARSRTVSEPETDPEEAAVLSERREIVRRALEDLPESQRAALRLAYFGGMSQREVAERTGAPLGTVKSRIRMGLGKLEEQLAPVFGGSEGGVT